MNTPLKNINPFYLWLLLVGLLLGCSSESKPGVFSSMGYHVGKTKVWLKSPRSGMEVYAVNEVVGADPRTFYSKTLANNEGNNQVVGFDANGVFWGFEQVQGADVATFEYVGSEYFKDKSHGYHLAYCISNDAQHFEQYDEFARDLTNVYFGGSVFSDDASNFIRIGGTTSRYYKDRTRCWFFISPIAEADPVTMRYIDMDYAMDATHVFHQMNIIDSAEPASFKLLEKEFSCDVNSVYLQSSRIEGADPISFRVLNERNGVDKAHCYYNGQMLTGADPATFRLIDEFYSTDSKHVWINGNLIAGADPATFRVVQGSAGKSRDAKFEYDMAERVGSSK